MKGETVAAIFNSIGRRNENEGRKGAYWNIGVGVIWLGTSWVDHRTHSTARTAVMTLLYVYVYIYYYSTQH